MGARARLRSGANPSGTEAGVSMRDLRFRRYLTMYMKARTAVSGVG